MVDITGEINYTFNMNDVSSSINNSQETELTHLQKMQKQKNRIDNLQDSGMNENIVTYKDAGIGKNIDVFA